MKLRNIIAKSELDYYRQHINFTHEEEIVFDMLSKGKSIKEIADKLNTSESTIGRRSRNVRRKLEECMDRGKVVNSIPVWEKLNLTIREAAEYSGISESILRDRVNSGEYDFILKNGTKTLIKRKLFEKYLESVDAI